MAGSIHLENPELTVDGKDFIIASFWGGKTENFVKTIDLKAFYLDLHDMFLNNPKLKFKDMLGKPEDQEVGKFLKGGIRRGEHISPDGLRTRRGDMYERKYSWNRWPAGHEEFELNLKARADLPGAGYGWVEVTIDIAARVITRKEVLVGSDKKELMHCKWEFRNRIKYKNSVLRDVVNNIPVIKNSTKLKGLVLNYFYLKDINKDLDDIDNKLKPLINGVLAKHFS